MARWKLLGVALSLTTPSLAAFNVYALHDREAVISSLGVSSDCLSALNYTVQCDGTNAVRATKNSDNSWSTENLTTLCTDDCSQSLSTWLETVEEQCEGEEVVANGLVVDPRAFPLKYISGYDQTCLKDSKDKWCFFESQNWDSSVYTSWDKIPVPCEDDCDGKDSEKAPGTLFVTNAYDKELYCSECFLLLWKQRIESPVFPQGNLMNHFTEQLNKLEAACSTKLPPTTPAPTVVLGPKETGTETSGHRLGAPTIFRSTQAPAPTATEEVVQRSLKTRALETFFESAVPNMTPQLGALDACGKYYNVAPGDTCDFISAQLGLTLDELIAYNPRLNRNCDNLWANFAICVAPVSPSPVSMDGDCGKKNPDASCKGSPSGSCCNDEGKCEACEPQTTAHPATSEEESRDEDSPKDGEEPTKNEDQEKNTPTPPALESPKPVPSGGTNFTMISKDGSCNKYILCGGTPYGKCCSTSGYCGSGPEWCGVGNCVSGDCDTKDFGMTTDGRCGPLFPGNKICAGSRFGRCCSKQGYCGSTELHCGENCHSGCDGAKNLTDVAR